LNEQTGSFLDDITVKSRGLFGKRITVGQNIIAIEPKVYDKVFVDYSRWANVNPKLTNMLMRDEVFIYPPGKYIPGKLPATFRLGGQAGGIISKTQPVYKGLVDKTISGNTIHTGGFPTRINLTRSEQRLLSLLDELTPDYESVSKLFPEHIATGMPKHIVIPKQPTKFIPPGSITGISGVTIGRGGTSLFMDITPQAKLEPEIKSITDIKGDVKLATARATLRTPVISIKSDMLTDTMSDTRLDVFSGMRTATQSKLASAQKLASVFESSLIKETVEVPKMRTIGRIRFLSPPRGGGGGGAGGYGVGFYPIGYRFRKWKTPKMEDLLKLK